jgi:mannose-6-phosphate isomerase
MDDKEGLPLPRVVAKPWGSEVWWAHTSRYAGKILRVAAGHRLSVQSHRSKDETFYLLSGRLLLLKGPTADSLTSQEVHAGEGWRNRPGEIHAIEASSLSAT